ncbi:MAG: hypothetical protein KAG20_11030 [Cocleimonas sp.]|nr:hypothetical protein [Cocleimonas sp.]
MLATILSALFILLVIAVLIGWYLFIKRIRRKSDMSSEPLFLIAVASLTLLLFALWQFSDSIKGIQWKGWDSNGSIFSSENSEEIHNFTLKVYKPLVYSLDTVDSEINDMNMLLDDVGTLIDEHPRHSLMLIQAKKTWSDGLYQLKKLKKVIKKDIRRAWIAHDTMNQKTVDTKFSREAVKLDKHLNSGLQTFRKLIISVHSVIRKDLASSQMKLGKKQQKEGKIVRVKSQYSTHLSGKLLAFSETIDPKIHEGMESLIDEIAVTEQRQEKNKEHLEENQDLEGPLIKVIDYWKEAEIHARRYLDQLLYALESELLGRKLGLKKKDYAVISMHNSLRKKIPKILIMVKNKRIAIDNSY